MRENDIYIIYSAHPFGVPFYRYESVIIDRTQCAHYICNRESSLTHKIIRILAVGILHVNVLYVSTEIFDGSPRSFRANIVRIMKVPQSAHIIARKIIEQLSQACRIGIYARCFHNKHLVVFFGIDNCLFNKGVNIFICVFMLHSLKTYVRRMKLSRYRHAVIEFVEIFRFTVCNIRRHIYTRNCQTVFYELSSHRGEFIGIALFYIVKLYTVKFIFFCYIKEIVKLKALPPVCRKR